MGEEKRFIKGTDVEIIKVAAGLLGGSAYQKFETSYDSINSEWKYEYRISDKKKGIILFLKGIFPEFFKEEISDVVSKDSFWEEEVRVTGIARSICKLIDETVRG